MAARPVRQFAALIDERQQPTLRDTLGRLLSCARSADIAVAHIRLARLDLSSSELGKLERCRVMLGHFDASFVANASTDAAAARARAALLVAFAQSGRLQIRTAPHHAWNPDFSIFRGLPGERTAVLFGAHYFGEPYPMFGAAITCVLTHSAAVTMCGVRFEEMWAAGYDVLPIVGDALQQLSTV